MSIRLNKLLARRGIGARRKCDLLIEEGRVRVNGQVVSELGTMVEEGRDRIEVMGRPLPPAAENRYYVLNKPVGVISTLSDPEGRRTVSEFLPPGTRLFPVGRLDADTSGLLVLTNDGELAHRLMHPRYGVEKVYRAWLDRPPTDGQLARLRDGVEFEPGVVSEPARVRKLEADRGQGLIEIAIHEGRYRQVRRMCEAVGLQVTGLHRWAYGPIKLGPIERGMWRELSHEEVSRLKSDSSRPVARGRGKGGEFFSARRGLVSSHRPPVSTRSARRPSEGAHERSRPAERGDRSQRPQRPASGVRPPRPSTGSREGRPARAFERAPRETSAPPRRFERSERPASPARIARPVRKFERAPRETSAPPRRFERSERPASPARVARPVRKFERAPRETSAPPRRNARSGRGEDAMEQTHHKRPPRSFHRAPSTMGSSPRRPERGGRPAGVPRDERPPRAPRSGADSVRRFDRSEGEPRARVPRDAERSPRTSRERPGRDAARPARTLDRAGGTDFGPRGKRPGGRPGGPGRTRGPLGQMPRGGARQRSPGRPPRPGGPPRNR